ncbi:hypothetical protein [Vibrio phage P23]|nr:hypothetical protein [Vibrio phage P23]
MKKVMDAQRFVLVKCLDEGFFIMQKKRCSKINEAAKLAVKAGLMTFVSERKLALTIGGVKKASELKGE